jgi:hypothetical protein
MLQSLAQLAVASLRYLSTLPDLQEVLIPLRSRGTTQRDQSEIVLMRRGWLIHAVQCVHSSAKAAVELASNHSGGSSSPGCLSPSQLLQSYELAQGLCFFATAAHADTVGLGKAVL